MALTNSRFLQGVPEVVGVVAGAGQTVLQRPRAAFVALRLGGSREVGGKSDLTSGKGRGIVVSLPLARSCPLKCRAVCGQAKAATLRGTMRGEAESGKAKEQHCPGGGFRN
jgi:hypothetical protein